LGRAGFNATGPKEQKFLRRFFLGLRSQVKAFTGAMKAPTSGYWDD
jgi:hypothetical protein